MGPVGGPSAASNIHHGPGNLVWLASYPKSGNTWLRGLITAYRHSPEMTLDINALGSASASSRVSLDELLGLPTSDLTTGEVRSLLPHAYRSWSGLDGGPHCLKTHDAYALTLRGEPMFPAEATRCVVHLVRDPRDVVASAMHHWGLNLDRTIACINDRDYWIGQSHKVPNVPQYLSDWSRHALSWLDCPLPRLTLRYEDMLADAAGHLRGVLAAIGLDLDSTRLVHAVASCTLERLQTQERVSGFAERLHVATAPFFRSGKAGGWRDVLSASQAKRIVDAHGDTMQRLGYAV